MTTAKPNIASPGKNSDDFPMSINDVFPNEILGVILSKLTVQTDLLQARLVCTRWRFVLDELVGYTALATSFYSVVKHLPFEDIKNVLPKNLKSTNVIVDPSNNMSIRHLTIGFPGMLINDGIAAAVERRIIHLKDKPMQIVFPHILKSLSCLEPICPDILTGLSGMTTLTYLNFSLFSLISLEGIDKTADSIILLRSLKALTISTTQAYAAFDCSTVIPQLNVLLNRLETPALANLDITYPVVSLLDVDEDSTNPTMQFLRRTPSIRTFSVMVISPNQNFISPSKEFIYPEDLQDEMGSLGSKLHLKSVKLRDNHLHSLRPSTHVKGWTALFKQLKQLQTLEFSIKSSIELDEDVMFIVRNNVDTLKTLNLACFPCQIKKDSQDIYFVPVDSSLLSCCRSLENIRICDNLVNTISLPPCLKKIYVDAMLTNKDSEAILLFFKGTLEHIELKDTRGGVPKGFGFGVPIPALERFVGMRKTKRITIYSGSMDGPYPVEGIPNQDIYIPKRLHKRMPPVSPPPNTMTPAEFERFLAECVHIDWTINERGFYEDIEGQDEVIKKIEEKQPPREGKVEEREAPAINHQLFRCSNLISSFQ